MWPPTRRVASTRWLRSGRLWPSTGVGTATMIAEAARRRLGSVGSSGRILLDRDRTNAGFPEQEVEDLLDRPGAARGKVIDLAGLALLQQEPVAADDISDVGVVAAGGEIADMDHGLATSGLDLGDLSC